MSDRSTSEQTPKGKRSIPWVVWLVLGLVAVWLVVILVQRNTVYVSPRGGTHPEAAQGPAVIPPAPASGDAPATPGGVVNGDSSAPTKP